MWLRLQTYMCNNIYFLSVFLLFFCLVSLKPSLGRFSSVWLSVEPSGDDVTGVTDRLDAVWLAVGILLHRCLCRVWVRCRTDTSSISGGLTSCWGSRGMGFSGWRTERTEGEQEVGGTERSWRKTLFFPGGDSESKKNPGWGREVTYCAQPAEQSNCQLALALTVSLSESELIVPLPQFPTSPPPAIFPPAWCPD